MDQSSTHATLTGVHINRSQVRWLAMPFHINGEPLVVIPWVGQFGSQEWNYISSPVSAFLYANVVAGDIRVYRAPIRLCVSDDTAGIQPLRLYEGDAKVYGLSFKTPPRTH